MPASAACALPTSPRSTRPPTKGAEAAPDAGGKAKRVLEREEGPELWPDSHGDHFEASYSSQQQDREAGDRPVHSLGLLLRRW